MYCVHKSIIDRVGTLLGRVHVEASDRWKEREDDVNEALSLY